MWPLAAAFIEIALHRRGPRDIPASTFLTWLLVAVYFPVNFASLYLRGGLSLLNLAVLLGDTTFYFAFVFAVLRYFKRDARFAQTVNALLGTDIFINAVGIGAGLVGAVSGAPEDATWLFWIYVVILLWWIDVAGYVVAKALDQPYIAGLMFVILYVMTSFSIQDALTPTPA